MEPLELTKLVVEIIEKLDSKGKPITAEQLSFINEVLRAKTGFFIGLAVDGSGEAVRVIIPTKNQS